MLIGTMVMKNEADRYLESSLMALHSVCDALFIVDDRSTDGSAEIALRYGMVWSPPDTVPTFLEDESAFRQAAWVAMTETFDLCEDDWVLSVDADEIICFTRDDFEALTSANDGVDVFSLKIHEVYQITDALWERVDGFWGDIRGERLIKFSDYFFFKNKKMGCGSLPIPDGANVAEIDDLHIVHLGYLSASDRMAKYERYSSMKNNGHSSRHIESIVRRPTLKMVESRSCCSLDSFTKLVIE